MQTLSPLRIPTFKLQRHGDWSIHTLDNTNEARSVATHALTFAACAFILFLDLTFSLLSSDACRSYSGFLSHAASHRRSHSLVPFRLSALTHTIGRYVRMN